MKPKITLPHHFYVDLDGVCRTLQQGEWRTFMGFCPHESFLGVKLSMYEPEQPRYLLIYLRWRYEDPWKAKILQSNEAFEINYESTPADLMIGWSTEDELEQAQKRAIDAAKKTFELWRWQLS